MLRYKCERCGEKLESDDSFAGLTDDCPVCGHKNAVPKTRKQLKEEKRRQKEVELAELERGAIALRRKKEQQEKAEEEKRKAKKKEYETLLMSVRKESHTTKMWYCFVEGKQWGPMTESRLQAWISENRVKYTNKIRPESINTWLKLSDLPEIFSFSAIEPSNKIISNNDTKSDSPHCPRCGSSHISANKKGVDAGNACCGALLFGPLGLLCGFTESNKVLVTCLKCGHQWKAGR